MNVTVLVDFENDSVRGPRSRSRTRSGRASGASGSTRPESLVDRSLWDELGDFKPTGVNPRLVWKVREALDARRLRPREDRRLRRLHRREDPRVRGGGVPVDAYGVGSSLIRGSNDFTGDIVLTDGKPSAKVGRRFRVNPRLELVT